jgi:photosystem II stability/assembly factor-like uncharacterized protein
MRHTVNGGSSWTSVAAPPTALSDEATQGVSTVRFADANNGWAFGNALWATHDGAQHWHKVAFAGVVVALASGNGEAYALSDPCGFTNPCTSKGALYRTPVGTDDWQAVPGVSGNFAVGTGAGLVVEGSAVFVLSPYTPAELLAAPDGTHFSALPIPCQPGAQQSTFSPASVAASDPMHLVVACVGGPASGQAPKQAFESADGGHSYVRVADPPTQGDGVELATPSPGSAMSATSSPGGSAVFRFSGGSWSPTFTSNDGGASITDLAFTDPHHGVLVHAPIGFAIGTLGGQYAASLPAPGRLYLSADGGLTWRPVDIPA